MPVGWCQRTRVASRTKTVLVPRGGTTRPADVRRKPVVVSRCRVACPEVEIPVCGQPVVDAGQVSACAP